MAKKTSKPNKKVTSKPSKKLPPKVSKALAKSKVVRKPSAKPAPKPVPKPVAKVVSKKPAPTVVVLASKKPKVASRVLVKRAIASLTRQGKAKQIEAIEEPKSKVKTLGKKLPRSKNSDRFVSSITVKIPKPETSPAYFADGTSNQEHLAIKHPKVTPMLPAFGGPAPLTREAGRSASPAASSHSPYSVHPSISYLHSVINNMKAKTGRSLDEWIALTNENGWTDYLGIQSWLKQHYGLGATTVGIIADYATGNRMEEYNAQGYLKQAEVFVQKMYEGPKEWMRPLHDRLIAIGLSLGNEVRICPCETIVPMYRNHVFAQIKPATNKRLEFGLALKDHAGKLPKRLIDTGGLKKNDRITHRFEITQVSDIDAEISHWTKVAFDLDK